MAGAGEGSFDRQEEFEFQEVVHIWEVKRPGTPQGRLWHYERVSARQGRESA
jgi:hypothetical protein